MGEGGLVVVGLTEKHSLRSCGSGAIKACRGKVFVKKSDSSLCAVVVENQLATRRLSRYAGAYVF